MYRNKELVQNKESESFDIQPSWFSNDPVQTERVLQDLLNHVDRLVEAVARTITPRQ